MAEQHHVKIPAHYNIYSGESGRELRVEFSTPSEGINQKTGILLLVPGFGGNIDSKVYKKMRETFADEFNLIVIQCDYFGSSYMQAPNSIQLKNIKDLTTLCTEEEVQQILDEPNQLLTILSTKSGSLEVLAEMEETIDEFNDMGYMQAIDLITTIELVKAIIHDNGFIYDESRVLGYGHSHGAYLLHLANRLVPDLFSYIIDNSSWLEPRYLKNDRILYKSIKKFTLVIQFDYLAKKLLPQRYRISLQELYRFSKTDTQIISFQGDDDSLVNYIEKQAIISSLPNSQFELVTNDNVDYKKIKSNKHGLDADFLELFSYALQYERPLNRAKHLLKCYKVRINEDLIEIDTTKGLPIFYFK